MLLPEEAKFFIYSRIKSAVFTQILIFSQQNICYKINFLNFFAIIKSILPLERVPCYIYACIAQAPLKKTFDETFLLS